MSWLIAVMIAIAGLAWVFWYVREGLPEPIGRVESGIIGVLRQGYDGGLLTLMVPDLRDKIFMRKYIRAPREYGVKLVVSSQEMSPERFAAAANFLGRRTESCEESAQVEDGAERPHHCLEVDFGMDTADAARMVIDFFQEIYGLSLNDSIIVKLDNAASPGTVIDGTGPNESRLS